MLSTKLILLFFATASLPGVYTLDSPKDTPSEDIPASNHDLALRESVNQQLTCISSCTSANLDVSVQAISFPTSKILSRPPRFSFRSSEVTLTPSLALGPGPGASSPPTSLSIPSPEISDATFVTAAPNQPSIFHGEPNQVLASPAQPSTQQQLQTPMSPAPTYSSISIKSRLPFIISDPVPGGLPPHFLTTSPSPELAFPMPPSFPDNPSPSTLLEESPAVPKLTHVPTPLPRSSPGVLPITLLAPTLSSPTGPSMPGVSVVPGASAVIIPLTPSVIVQVPQQPFAFTTITEMYDGTTTGIFVVATPYLPGQTGTVIVRIPQTLAVDLKFTTITSVYSGTDVATLTAATPSLLGQVGTVIVQLPAGSTTLSSLHPSLALTAAITAVPSAVDEFGTIRVQIPQQFTALTLLSTPGASQTVDLSPGNSTVAGTMSRLGLLYTSSIMPPFIGGAGREAVIGWPWILLGVAGMVLAWL
ncbi:hypothetical protein HBH56_168590 [Parastagonospora nodorum]|uniref:Uncharacterized protein n=2 Tax=Phaeosphaeria nodorum (strain SN15 / ATCC MYA-4574 / FGSC 10173) TaxID=321614 RepID=A0A7U2F944_PHANO|nr:hypothetical protein SNOG_04744 [Parastagonospora nodorum SN15]KAH3909131.1 hypothetical protein HBH56_168590 [Parastagonospora nodorum]EAT88504.1 hypothetical protein SNOG_04744 [Parastagonospora nodorum SN15]KAH3936146.1 hypothetical protein HBH54_031680 [Parastagonospora nodorum]KAH3948316.1 hypothetical protein HBH53_106440 [Parastagonospora nodorum]KAH4076962.1 hypothetical protein HBH50_012970 [Parastagonospora nodorum]